MEPDKVRVYIDRAGETRWTRRSSGNWEVIGDSGEGYSEWKHGVAMAYRVNGGNFIVVDEHDNIIPEPSGDDFL